MITLHIHLQPGWHRPLLGLRSHFQHLHLLGLFGFGQGHYFLLSLLTGFLFVLDLQLYSARLFPCCFLLPDVIGAPFCNVVFFATGKVSANIQYNLITTGNSKLFTAILPALLLRYGGLAATFRWRYTEQ